MPLPETVAAPSASSIASPRESPDAVYRKMTVAAATFFVVR